jgi:hypothetical protein
MTHELIAYLAQVVQSAPSTVNEYGVWIVSVIFVPAIGALWLRQEKQQTRQDKQQERQDKQHEECLQEREKLHVFLAEQIAKYAETRINESKQHAENFMIMAKDLAKIMHQADTDWRQVTDWMERTDQSAKVFREEILTSIKTLQSESAKS